MSRRPSAETILKKANNYEKEYEWLKAANSYKQALRLEPKNTLSSAITWQKIAFCLDLASRQARNLEKCNKLRQLAIEAYKKAATFYEKEDGPKYHAAALQCNTISKYFRSWLTPDSSDRKKMLDECRTLGNKALKAYENAGNLLGYGKTCNILLLCLFDRIYIASNAKEKQMVAKEGTKYGDQAISTLSDLDNKNELLLAYSAASLQNWYAANISEQEKKRNELANKSLAYSEKAVDLSKDVDNPHYIAMSRWAATLCTLFFADNVEESLHFAKEMLQLGLDTRDNYIQGVASYLLAYVTDWIVPRETTTSKKKERCKEIIEHAKEAIHHLTLFSQDFITAETYLFYSESYSSLAQDEADIGEKRELLEEAVKTGLKGLEYATRSGSPDAKASILHALSKALHLCSDLEREKHEKRRLLEEALIHRKDYIEIVQGTFPSNYWVFGVGKYYEALLEAELARLETDEKQKTSILEKATADMDEGISHCEKWILSRPSPSLTIFVAEFQDKFGNTLNELHLLNQDEAILTSAIAVFNSAAEKYVEVDLPSRAAESYWKAARNKDRLGRYIDAADDFSKASIQYEAAARKISQFADFYEDYAIYMKAWYEIEKAKSAHNHEEYSNARQHYEGATNLLKQSELWNYLASNFHALSLLEYAEDLSRKESNTEAIMAFKEAAKLFEGAKEHVENAQSQSETLQVKDEKRMLDELVGIFDVRREYCIGRIAIEEAKILDRNGNHLSSSGKYAFAAAQFQKAVDIMKHEADRLELKPIILICQAWQMMTKAEAETSPDLYLEAAKLFDKAKSHSINERAKILALGHSRFCSALEASTRYETTKDKRLHLAAVQHLESAANYYIKAGFNSAAEYAIATRRLLDGYGYMDGAILETDPEKKARYYSAAEKVLQTSAESFAKAKHTEKALQVKQLLDKVREERSLATSLSEVLHAPTIASSTTSFVTPTSSHENPVGLERFEHTNVQAHLTVREEVTMDENIEIQLDLVNVAKNSGLLVRINDLVPKGFKITETSPEYDLENDSIDLGGKKFEPLKVESIKFSARATDFGIFKISPQVVYVDDTGQFRICRPQSANVKVQAPSKMVKKEQVGEKYELVYKDLLKEFQQMPKSKCRVAIAQIGVSKSGDILNELYEEKTPGLFNLRKEKVETVRLKVKNMIQIANSREVDVLLFPELTVDLSYGKLLRDIMNLAKAYEMYIIPGSYHDEKTRRNISSVVGPNGILWRQEKHIPAIIHHEGKRFSEGIDVGEFPRKTLVCNTEFGRMTIAICRDFLDMDLRVELKNSEPPVDVVLNPAFTPVTADFQAVHFDARRSIYAYCFFANVAEFGDSMIYTPEKERVERRIPAGEESIIYKDIDFFKLRSERKKWEIEQKKEKQFIQSTR